ncbi:MAG: sugar phosphate isomerase/epimerase, partial [Propionibacterium sp.]|nr:sugar phosphate isomerase/epimerase [Propionibacterium sp.]
MKLGMLTACLPSWTLEQVAEFAQQTGYERLEVAVWPGTGGRDFEASHLPVASFTEKDADDTRALLERTGLEISAFAYYENNLIGDLARREEIRTHLKHAIDAAQMLGVPYVGTFLGRDVSKSVRENMREAERVLPELVDYAGERGIKLIIENCVMEGWHPDGYPGNIAYSPELWEWMTKELGFYLNWDPSHLTWIGIDPLTTIEPFAEYIVHAQAKDLEILEDKRNQYGFFGLVE